MRTRLAPRPDVTSIRIQLALGLFLFFLGFYGATASGHTVTIDGEYYFRAAESLVLRRTLAVEFVSPRDEGLFADRAPDGRVFGKFAPLQSIAEAPYYVALRSIAEPRLGDGPELARFLRVWVPVATTATISAGLAALIGLAVVGLGYSRSIGLAVALLLGLTTLIWPYGRSEFSEPLQGLLLLGAFLCVRRAGGRGSVRVSLLTGILLGLLGLAKAINLLVLPVFGLALLWRLRRLPRRTLVGSSLAYGLAALVGIAAFLLLNQARTGSPLNFGYDDAFDTPLWLGLYGWTLSPGKGVFLYMPLLLVAAVAYPAFARRHGFEAAVIAATTAVLVFFYARFWAWSGDWSWGVRFAVPLLPLWMLPLATGLVEWRNLGRGLLASAAAASLAIQTLGVLIDPMAYLSYYYDSVSPLIGEGRGYTWAKEARSAVHFAPGFSPLLGHWQSLLATISADRKEALSIRPITLGDPPSFARALGISRWLPPPNTATLGFDLFWLRSPPGTGGSAALAGLTTLAVAGLALAIRGARASPDPRRAVESR